VPIFFWLPWDSKFSNSKDFGKMLLMSASTSKCELTFNETEQFRFTSTDDMKIRLQFSALQREHWHQTLTNSLSTAYSVICPINLAGYDNQPHSIIFNCYSGGCGVQLGPLALRPLIGLLCPPRVMMRMKLMESLAGETAVLGENLPSAALSTTNPTREPGPPRWKASE
jgi:hypothetical protein